MYMLVVGGGKLGANLAEMLSADGHEVIVVEQDAARVRELAEMAPMLTVVEGDGCEPAILESAQVSRAEAIAAVTGDDEDNLVVCLLARRQYKVARTAARVNDPRNEWLFDGTFGVDHAVSGTRGIAALLTQDIEDAT